MLTQICGPDWMSRLWLIVEKYVEQWGVTNITANCGIIHAYKKDGGGTSVWSYNDGSGTTRWWGQWEH